MDTVVNWNVAETHMIWIHTEQQKFTEKPYQRRLWPGPSDVAFRVQKHFILHDSLGV